MQEYNELLINKHETYGSWQLFPEPPTQVKYKQLEDYLIENGVTNISRANLSFYINKGMLPPLIKEKGKANQGLYDKRHIFGYMLIVFLKEVYSLEFIQAMMPSFVFENDPTDNGSLIKSIYTFLYNINKIHNETVQEFIDQSGEGIDGVLRDLLFTLSNLSLVKSLHNRT